MEDGVWRTVGGRRIFIKKGQSLQSAMKDSGKFNKATKTKKKVDPNDLEALRKIADSGENIDNYEGLDDIAKDYIKNRRKELGNEEFTKKANEIHEKSLEKAKESEKTTDEDKRYNTKQEREKEFEKNIEEQYNRFHGKTDKEVAEEIAKERGERILTDEEQKQREVEFMKNLEKEVDSKKETKRLEEIQRQAQAKYDHAKDKYEHYKFDDSEDARKYREEYNKAKDELTKANRDYDEQRLKPNNESNENLKNALDDVKRENAKEYLKKNTYLNDEQAKDYVNRLENLGKESKVPDAYKDSMITSRNDDEVIRDLKQRKEQLATHKDRYTSEEYKKQEDGLNAGIKYAEQHKTTGQSIQDKYGLRDKRNEMTVKHFEDGDIDQQELKQELKLGGESEETIKNIINESNLKSNDWVKKAFAQYKKDHPKTKLTINDFKKQQK